jgi:N-methylhydantoinase A
MNRILAVDTGGTFTDLVLLERGEIRTLKVPSTPHDPSQAVLDGIREILGEGQDFVLLHGSTVATNALLERRGARVVLVTNEGFEDVIEIGRQDRPQLYALVGHRPPPLVRREDRIGIPGRLGPQGEEITRLDMETLTNLATEISNRGAEAVAISLLHSYANSDHERVVAAEIAAGLREISAQGAPASANGGTDRSADRSADGSADRGAITISVSSDLVPEFREYERTSTTVINAYVAPIMDRYLGRLAAEAGAKRVTIMGSNGGVLPIERARREPVQTVLSGPAGGVVGALTWAKRAGHDSVITFDMGGTSTDVSLCPGRPLRTREFMIGGQPAAIPVIDIHTVGAGGGSIARVDTGGALRVGPRSAGAQPGPICYGNGGTEVAVTDAHVWLGRLPASAFLGGRRPLDRAAVEGPLQRIADALGGSLDHAAEGILAVADTAMERALRVISVERGYDPADFAVVAFGGAGGLHVAELTERIGAARALVPPDPGLLSAYGMLASPVTREVSRTVLLHTDLPDLEHRLREVLDELEAGAVSEMISEGSDRDALVTERWIDARYQGQSFELSVPEHGWISAFHTSHEERYEYRRDETPVEAVTLRVIVTGPAPELNQRPIEAANAVAPIDTAQVTYDGEAHDVARVWRQDLRAGHEIPGPAIVQEYSGTTWIPHRWMLRVDDWGCLHLTPTE